MSAANIVTLACDRCGHSAEFELREVDIAEIKTAISGLEGGLEECALALQPWPLLARADPQSVST